jgi:hypothetical protein
MRWPMSSATPGLKWLRLRIALVHGKIEGGLPLSWFAIYLIRVEIGMPRFVIRLRTAHPILASVF